MALAFANLVNVGDTAGGDPVTSTSFTTVAGRLYLMTVISSTTATLSSVVGPASEAWTFIEDEPRGSVLVVSIYFLLCATGGTGTAALDFSAATTGTVIIVEEVTGAHASTPIVTTNKITGNGTDAVAPTEVTLTLPNALSDANNAIYSSWGLGDNTTFTAGTDYTKLGDAGHAAPIRTGASEYDIAPGDLVTDGTFALASQWAGVAVEIAVAAAAAGPPPSVRLALTGIG